LKRNEREASAELINFPPHAHCTFIDNWHSIMHFNSLLICI
jgi:hypothetical protein